MLEKFLAVLGCIFITWVTYTAIKRDPSLLSKENLSKSFGTLGMLGIGLILLVGLVVLLLRNT